MLPIVPRSHSSARAGVEEPSHPSRSKRVAVETLEREAHRACRDAPPIAPGRAKRGREEEDDVERTSKRVETAARRLPPERHGRGAKRKGEETAVERSVRRKGGRKENHPRPEEENEVSPKKACLERAVEEVNLHWITAGACAIFSRHEELFVAGLALDGGRTPQEQLDYLTNWLIENQPLVEELHLDEINEDDLAGFRDLLCYSEERSLKALPDFFHLFPDLVEFTAADNELSDLPSSFKETAIDTLVLKGNRFERVPEVVGSLDHLVELDLSSQKVVLDLSEESPLWKASSLVRLALSNNRIVSLGDQFAQLESLRYLDLEGVSLNVLPNSLLALEQLIEINLIRTTLPFLEIESFLVEALAMGRNPILIVDTPHDRERDIPAAILEKAFSLGYYLEYRLRGDLTSELRALKFSQE